MLVVTGISDKPCCLTGSTRDTVMVRFQDGTFRGVVAWDELLKMVKRRNGHASKEGETKRTAPKVFD